MQIIVFKFKNLNTASLQEIYHLVVYKIRNNISHGVICSTVTYFLKLLYGVYNFCGVFCLNMFLAVYLLSLANVSYAKLIVS